MDKTAYKQAIFPTKLLLFDLLEKMGNVMQSYAIVSFVFLSFLAYVVLQ